jgi:oligoribonuclease
VPEPRTVPLCGNSIGTDRRFLAAYLPDIENFLHYRSVDVSTIKELAVRWAPEVVDSAPRKETTHRALDDIRESVNELRWYRDHLFRLPDSEAPAPREGQ